MKRKVFFPILAAAIIASVFASSNIVSAQDTTGANSLVAAIAAKFNLNQADVQAVFDEEHNKREAEMKAQMETKLTEAVTAGKITEAQKTAIQEKFGQPFMMKIKPEEAKEMSEEDVIKIRDEKKAEMDAWLSQNGLTHELLREVMGHPKGFGPGKKVLFMAH